jgi:anthranilate phosphoribosyltransferase
VRLSGDALTALTITPQDAGFEPLPLASLRGGGVEENAERLKALLMGYGTKAEVQAVALNAGALLMTAGLAADLKEGASMAIDALASGKPARVLKAFVEASHA